MHLLLYDRTAYIQQDLTQALKDEGITISTFTHTFTDKNRDDAFYHAFSKELSEYTYDAVFSVNYYPLIAQVCYEKNTKYISWSYDCPLDVRNIEETLGYPTNYVFLFDRLQALQYENQGFEHIYHLPLAVNTERLNRMIPSSANRKQFGADISFVGSLYPSVYEQLTSPLADYTKGYLNGICESQLLLYGCFFINELITPDLLAEIEERYRVLYPESNFHIIKEELSYTMATQITNQERIRLLSLLGTIPDIQLKLFSKDTCKELENLQHCGCVDYMTQMPYVFKNSKINLNITLKCLSSGIPLRALDIMGCGGFLLSNYQPELNEAFINGEEFVAYSSIEEALDLAKYYITHDTIREQIASRGYEKVVSEYGYKKQLKTLFDTVGFTVI